MSNNKVVLAYSGGLDTSIIIPWLRENHDLEVHCIAGDVGQGAEELNGLEEKAISTGRDRCQTHRLYEAPLAGGVTWVADHRQMR